jgi:DNA-binding transcriptional ArsR family regulator
MRAFKHPPIEQVSVEHVLYALSDSVRLAIVRTLVNEGEVSCAALDCGKAKSSMSHHFRVLRESGLMQTRCEGVTHLNSVRYKELEKRFPGLLKAILAAED